MRDLKEAALSVITEMLKEEIITPADLLCYRSNEIDTDHPDEVRSQMEHWYKTLGVEQITGKPFHLTRPYFYKEEIREFRERGELLCCLPKGLSAKDLSELFHFHTWAEKRIGKAEFRGRGLLVLCQKVDTARTAGSHWKGNPAGDKKAGRS